MFTILLVEDSPLMRRLVREMLNGIGRFTIVEAADGGEALAVLERQPVDLVLSDLNMQPMDGLQLLQAMRGRLGIAGIPFIMMTSEQAPQNVAGAVAAGVNFYLTKPFSRDQLAKVVARITGGQVKAA